MLQLRRLGLLAVIVAFSVGCQANCCQPSSIVVRSNGWPGGWSSDGARVMISEYSAPPKIMSIKDDQTHYEPLPENFQKASGVCARWSPDGKSLAFNTYETQPQLVRLYVVDALHKDAALVASAKIMGCPTWFPDNQQFAVAISEGRRDVLRVFDRVKLASQDLFTAESSLADIAVSPDGKQIAFTDNHYKTSFVDLQTGQLTKLRPQSINGIMLTWSPDGQYIAYIEPKFHGGTGLAGNLVIAKADGFEPQILAGVEKAPRSGDYLFYLPMWSPRGDYIVAQRALVGDDTYHQRQVDTDVVLIPVPESFR